MDEIMEIFMYFLGNQVSKFLKVYGWVLIPLALIAVILLYCEIKLDEDRFNQELLENSEDEDVDGVMEDAEDFTREEVSDE